jgi:hypothetical protein
MGLFASIQTAAIAVSAGLAGALFGIAVWWPFLVAAVIGGLLTAALPWVWRGVPGRVWPEFSESAAAGDSVK